MNSFPRNTGSKLHRNSHSRPNFIGKIAYKNFVQDFFTPNLFLEPKPLENAVCVNAELKKISRIIDPAKLTNVRTSRETLPNEGMNKASSTKIDNNITRHNFVGKIAYKTTSFHVFSLQIYSWNLNRSKLCYARLK